jgi:hypothetical protein
VNHFQDAIDIGKHVVVPEAQHAIALVLYKLRSHGVRGILRVLTAIDFDHDALSMACEVHDVTPQPNLPTEMRSTQR